MWRYRYIAQFILVRMEICYKFQQNLEIFISEKAIFMGLSLGSIENLFSKTQKYVQAVMSNTELPEVLASVLQPHVEFYKKNLKGGVVVPGRISK